MVSRPVFSKHFVAGTVRLAILFDKRAQFVKDTVVKDKFCQFVLFCRAEEQTMSERILTTIGASDSVKNRINVARKFFASPLTRHFNER